MKMRMTWLLLSLVVSLAHGLARGDGPYPRMAPVDQYLIADAASEIALARSAAPPSIAGGATIYVLKRQKYEVAVKGKNGFACLVARSWDSPYADPQFWNPRLRGAMCLNPQAAETVLPEQLRRTELVLAGLPKEEIMKRMLGAYRAGNLRKPGIGAMSYMMSKDHYLDDADPAFRPHLMFYTPTTIGDAAWGANLANSPVIMRPNRLPGGGLEPLNVFLVPVPQWSDGTPAGPLHGRH
jgi:hypothetical protein